MSKVAKKRKAAARQDAKRKRKEANQRLYEARMAAGQNTKSKRSLKRLKSGPKRLGRSHIDGSCGNLACRQCYPSENTKWDRTRSWPQP